MNTAEASSLSALTPLDVEIETRVSSIRTHHSDWPCAKGCDACCRLLAEIPRLTPAEASRLQAGIAARPALQREGILRRLAVLGPQPVRPVTCPILDPDTGACLAYAARPIACRTYGFYVQRDKGLYCREIEERVANGQLAEVIWGNQDIIERQLSTTGETRSLSSWLGGEKLTLKANQATGIRVPPR